MSIAIQPIPPTGKVFTDDEVETMASEWTYREGATVQGLIRFVEARTMEHYAAQREMIRHAEAKTQWERSDDTPLQA